VYGNNIDEVIQIRDHTQPAPEDFYAHQDDLFSVYAITDAAGAVTQRYLYGDYGTRVTTDPAGRLHDETSGLIEYRHRWMGPEMGRFVQRDPLWYVDGANLYSYVLASPGRWSDPFGQSPIDWDSGLPRDAGQLQSMIDDLKRQLSQCKTAEFRKNINAQIERIKTQLKKVKQYPRLRDKTKTPKRRRGFTTPKFLARFLIASCLSGCGNTFDDCLSSEHDDYENCLEKLSSFKCRPLQRDWEGACDLDYALGVAECTTKATGCKLGCLLPFGIPGVG